MFKCKNVFWLENIPELFCNYNIFKKSEIYKYRFYCWRVRNYTNICNYKINY